MFVQSCFQFIFNRPPVGLLQSFRCPSCSFK